MLNIRGKLKDISYKSEEYPSTRCFLQSFSDVSTLSLLFTIMSSVLCILVAYIANNMDPDQTAP